MTMTFQDPQGNPITNGSLVVSLSADAKSSGGQIVAKHATITLDSNGVADITALAANASLTPNDTQYLGVVYAANGEKCWEKFFII